MTAASRSVLRALCALHALCAGLLLGGPAPAQPIRVVTETSPYVYQVDSRVAGSGAELVERTLQKAGLADFRIAVYPWARSYGMAREESHVLIFPLRRTPEREAQFQWVGEMVRVEYRLFALADRPEVRAASIDDARRLRTGVVRDDTRHHYLQRHAFGRLVVSADPQENFRKLLNRQIELVLLTDVGAQAQCAQAGGACPGLVPVLTLDDMASGLYLAYSPQTPGPVVQRTRAAFEALRADGTVARLMGAPEPARPAGAPARGTR